MSSRWPGSEQAADRSQAKVEALHAISAELPHGERWDLQA